MQRKFDPIDEPYQCKQENDAQERIHEPRWRRKRYLHYHSIYKKIKTANTKKKKLNGFTLYVLLIFLNANK